MRVKPGKDSIPLAGGLFNRYHYHQHHHHHYDTLSANVVKSFPKLAKSESGQIVSEKVKLTYFDVYLSQTM